MNLPPYQFELAAAWDPARRVATHEGVVYAANDVRPSFGPMMSYLGPRHSNADLISEDFERTADSPEVCLVRAWPVPRLIGAPLASDEAGLARVLEILLWDRLPGIDWRVPEIDVGPLRKYGMLHTAVAAPVDEVTGQPMALEIHGDVILLDGRPARGDWWTVRGFSIAEFFVGFDRPVAGALDIRIDVATYANVCLPGFGVPFYE